MSREIGGRADKDGNEFERLWVVEQALRVLQGTAISVQWEPSGETSFGIELEVALPNAKREVHQCKIERDTKGQWSAADLEAVGFWKAALRHLQRPSITEFVFVSRNHAAPALRDLCERTHRMNNDPELFYETALTSKEHRAAFQYVCQAWMLDCTQVADRASAFSLLQRLRFEIGIWDTSQRDRLERTAALLAEGEGRDIVEDLGASLSRKLGQDVHADQIRGYLRDAGHPPRDLRNDPRVSAGVERLQVSFNDSLEGLLLGGQLLPREETKELLRLLDDPNAPRLVFLHGPAGIGKSDVELELTVALNHRGTPFLPIRLDSQPPRGSLLTYSREVLGLPADPAQCLAVLAGSRPAVLLIDQLDALRWTGGHSAEALQVVKEIVKYALAVETIQIVLACRTFDLESDFKRWEQEYANLSQRLEVKPLGDEQVRYFVEQQGASYKSLNSAQRDLLRNPYTLFLWWELYKERGDLSDFGNTTDLLIEYRGHLVRRLGEMGRAEAPGLLEELVQYLDKNGRLDAPRAIVGYRVEALAALRSLNVLREPRHGFVTFAHQRLADFLIAELVARDAFKQGVSPVAWLRQNDQSLFRRDQLRQLLALLRDQDPRLYIETLKEIFAAKDIRFHLQHLALGILREPTNPTSDETSLVLRMLTSDEWRPHVLSQVLLGSPAWFGTLDNYGIVAQWLASGDDRLTEDALNACRSVAAKVPDRIERLLAPYWDSGDESWRNKIDTALGDEVERLTERMVGWRLAKVRDGSRRIDWFDLDDLAERNPTRAIMLLEAHLLCALDRFERLGKLNLDWRDRTRGALEKACKLAPSEAWDCLLPIMLRSIEFLHESPFDPEDLATALDPGSHRRGLQKINFHVRRLLAEAGAELAHREGLSVVNRLSSLFGMQSTTTQRLVLYICLKGPECLANFAIQWLYVDPRRLQLGSFKHASNFEPARRLIGRFSLTCAGEVYEKLEDTLLGFHP